MLGTGCAVDVPGGPFDTFNSGSDEAGSDEAGSETGETGEPCEGSALCLDPDVLCCDAPLLPTSDCLEPESQAEMQVDDVSNVTDSSPDPQEAEISTVILGNMQYVATQVLDYHSTGNDDPDVGAVDCVVQKGVRVYRRDIEIPNAEFVLLEVLEANGEKLDITLPPDNHPPNMHWYTDPYLAVSEETGVVYLSVLKAPGLDNLNCTEDTRTVEEDFDAEVQLWAIAPEDSQLQKVAVDDAGVSLISAGLNDDNPDRLDHPRVAVHSDAGVDRVVVTFLLFTPGAIVQPLKDHYATIECTWPGECNVVQAATPLAVDNGFSFSNPRFDTAGNLYIAHALRDGLAPISPEVVRYEWDGGWGMPEKGGPTPLHTYHIYDELTAPAAQITIDATPAIAIDQIGSATTPVVWLAWVTSHDADADNTTLDDYGIEIAAADANNLDLWITPSVPVPKRAGDPSFFANQWAPELAVDGDRNILDLVVYNSDASTEFFNLQRSSAIWPRVTRFRAHDLLLVAQANVVPTPSTDGLRVKYLPMRRPGSAGVFLGEYIGLAQDNGIGFVAWNLRTGLNESTHLQYTDVATVTFDAGCPMGLGLANGTSTVDSPLVTCSEPETALVGLDTFGTSLAVLCENFPLCGTADFLDLEITATLVAQTGQRPPTEGERVVGTAALQVVDGEVVFASEIVDEALGAGSHVVELCATDVSTSELLGCLEQPLVIASPVGSGADDFGHYAGEVALDFVPLSTRTGATALSLSDDGIATVSLPPALGFTFYGDPVEQVKVGSNGGLTFTGSAISPNNEELPTSAADAPDIAIYWDDLDPSTAGQVLTFFDGWRFIVSWEGVYHVASGDAVSVQAHLYPDGRIEMHYLDTTAGSTSLGHGATATLGIQSSGDFVLVSHDDSALLGSGVRALGFTTDECIASPLVIPPSVSCTAPDIGVSVCASHGLPVTVPTPNVEDCASSAVEVVGRVTHSGRTRGGQHERGETLPIVGGQVTLDVGVHTVEWTPFNSSGFAVGEPFVQFVHVGQWATQLNCCAPGQTVINLTLGSDTFTGGSAAECVLSDNGSDVVTTFGSADTVVGGRGSDTILTGADRDVLVCEPGDDVALGGSAPDLLDGGSGQDTLDGDGGDDVLDGGDGSDVVTSGAGADVLRGRAGDDVLVGGVGSDKLYPGSGVDAVFGDGGSDEIYLLDACELTSGKALSGGAGSDTLFVPPGITASDLAAAGVSVSSDIEQIVQLLSSRSFESDCG